MLILVADDLPDTRVIMKLLLEMKGHTVIQACNGQEAVESTFRDHPDLILMDMSMPIMDGLTATKRIRARGETTPIVALSAHMSDPEWRARAVRCGCNYCCSKPLDFDSLDEMLDAV